MSDLPLVVLEFHGHPEGEWCDDPACYQAPRDSPVEDEDQPVMAIIEGTNADLTVACHRLGYIRDTDFVLDPTYGLGRWWTKWRPAKLVTNDIKDLPGVDFHQDFRDLPMVDNAFDVVAFDPPYKMNGTGGSHASDEGYGVDKPYASWQSKFELIRGGILEAHRVLKPDGVLLLKCQDQVCGGRVRWQTLDFSTFALSIGFAVEDMLHLISYRAQPPGRTQQHARRNYSTMLVLRKAKR